MGTNPLPDTIPTTRRVWDRNRAILVTPNELVSSKPGRYLSGVIPLNWLSQADRLGGRCLAVGVLLWHLRNMRKRPVMVVSKALRGTFAISDRAYWEALRRLEGAGLVGVARHPGQALRVEILTAGAQGSPGHVNDAPSDAGSRPIGGSRRSSPGHSLGSFQTSPLDVDTTLPVLATDREI